MTKIIFVTHDAIRTTVMARDGESVMHAAIANAIDGITAQCGGSMMCATCHCYVGEAWVERAGPPADGEDEMLESATSELRETSRLSCQIKVTPALEGLVVHLPATQ